MHTLYQERIIFRPLDGLPLPESSITSLSVFFKENVSEIVNVHFFKKKIYLK